jgi:hypothetical protein
MTVRHNPVSAPLKPIAKDTLVGQGRAMVVHHGERILGEIPRLLRRVGLFVMVMAVSVPLFFVGLLVVLWHLGS